MEITVILSLAICIFLLLSHFGICGSLGNAASKALFGVFGLTAYIVPILLFVGITFVLSNKGNTQAYIKMGAVTVLYIMLCTVLQSFRYHKTDSLGDVYKYCANKKGGGVLGGLLLKLLDPAIGLVGLYIVIVVLTIISIVILTGKSFVRAVKTKGEEIYQTAKDDAARRREQAEQDEVEETIEEEPEEPEAPVKERKKKRIEKVVSGVSFDTTLEKEETEDVDIDVKVPGSRTCYDARHG